MRQKAVLIIAFLLPIIGIVIFRFYSESHFDVRVLYQNQNELADNRNCSGLSFPYHIDSEITLNSENNEFSKPFSKPHYKIFGFSVDSETIKTEMGMIADAFYDVEDVDIYLIEDSLQAEESTIPDATNIHKVKESKKRINELKDCVFLLGMADDDAVLVDDVNRIRGFYNLTGGEEVDSLIIETKILLRERKIGEDVHIK